MVKLSRVKNDLEEEIIGKGAKFTFKLASICEDYVNIKWCRLDC